MEVRAGGGKKVMLLMEKEAILPLGIAAKPNLTGLGLELMPQGVQLGSLLCLRLCHHVLRCPAMSPLCWCSLQSSSMCRHWS